MQIEKQTGLNLPTRELKKLYDNDSNRWKRGPPDTLYRHETDRRSVDLNQNEPVNISELTAKEKDDDLSVIRLISAWR